jgi:predicted transcriptional regulator
MRRSILHKKLKASDIAYQKKIYAIDLNSPLLLALNMMTGTQGIYRITVVDSARHVRGVISGLGVLEVMAGLKGEGISRRAGKGFEPLLKQPVRLFVDGFIHKLSHEMPIEGIVSYIMENRVGHIVLVDQMNVLRGVVTERCILDRLPLRDYGIPLSEIMTSKVFSVESNKTLLDASRAMSSHRVRRLPILQDAQVQGMITVTDILKHVISSGYHVEAVLSQKDMHGLMVDPVASVGTQEIAVLSPESDVGELLNKSRHQQSIGYPVLRSDGKIAGVISSRDIVSKLPKIIGIDRFIGIMNGEVHG